MTQTTWQNNTGRQSPTGKLLKGMVGPCGLEPQTSTVSIRNSLMTSKPRIDTSANVGGSCDDFWDMITASSGHQKTALARAAQAGL